MHRQIVSEKPKFKRENDTLIGYNPWHTATSSLHNNEMESTPSNIETIDRPHQSFSHTPILKGNHPSTSKRYISGRPRKTKQLEYSIEQSTWFHTLQKAKWERQDSTYQSSFPSPDNRESLFYDASDIQTTLNYLEESIDEVASASKNSINQGKAEIHFTCSIKKTSVVDFIFRCKQLIGYKYKDSEFTQRLAWYDPNGSQAEFNKYGPHITIRSPGKTTESGKTPNVYHHVYFKNGETQENK
ncbi:MAG: hypothetical protein ACFB2W_00340 [Leptolyngbyaceae cyanobacterium]